MVMRARWGVGVVVRVRVRRGGGGFEVVVEGFGKGF